MPARLMLSGVTGAGKTWTGLEICTVLAEGDRTRIMGIDTEHGSMLTYADNFPGFRHLRWNPPYDPVELRDVIEEIDATRPDITVLDIDSFTHFWRGVLEIADGKFGGWKEARPAHSKLIDTLLSTRLHVVLCVREKMEYLAETNASGRQQVTKVGLAPQQDGDLAYEMNVAVQIDLNHRIEVTKSRCPAVPVGRLYQPERAVLMAQDYKEWLAGGDPPADEATIKAVTALFSFLTEDRARLEFKRQFVSEWGMPGSLTEMKAQQAAEWVRGTLSIPDDWTAPEPVTAPQEGPPVAPATEPQQEEPVSAPAEPTEPVVMPIDQPTEGGSDQMAGPTDEVSPERVESAEPADERRPIRPGRRS